MIVLIKDDVSSGLPGTMYPEVRLPRNHDVECAWNAACIVEYYGVIP